jgi:hypothetical protein
MKDQADCFRYHLARRRAESRRVDDADEKLRIARQLERMRVDVIEAGFAAASNGDFEAGACIAEAIKDSTVCSLARANENDIRRAGEAIRPAKSGRIHTFIATSPIHMEKKLRMTRIRSLSRPSRRRLGARLHRRRRVFGRGCRPLRDRFPGAASSRP